MAKRQQSGMSRAAAAKVLNVTPQRINKWVSDGAPVLRRGRRGLPHLYDPAALRRWREKRDADTRASGLSLEQERALLARAQRLKVERENRVRSGELVEAAEASRHLVAAGIGTRDRLRRLPTALADRLVAAARDGGQAAVCQLLRVEIDSALWDLALAAGLPDTRRKDART